MQTHGRAPRRARPVTTSGLGEEARFLHQVVVDLLFLLDPLGVVAAAHEGVVERAFLQEFLPVRCDEQLDPHLLDLGEGSAVVNLVKQRSAQFDTKFVAGRDAMIISDCLGVVQPEVAHG